MTLDELNRPQEAMARFQESLQIKERIGDREGQANTQGEMGKILRDAGQIDTAITLFQQAIKIYYKLNNPRGVAMALEWIRFTLEKQSHFREALEKYQESLRLMQQHGGPKYVAHIEGDIKRLKTKMKQ